MVLLQQAVSGLSEQTGAGASASDPCRATKVTITDVNGVVGHALNGNGSGGNGGSVGAGAGGSSSSSGGNGGGNGNGGGGGALSGGSDGASSSDGASFNTNDDRSPLLQEIHRILLEGGDTANGG